MTAVEFVIEKYEKFINSENGSGEAYFYEQLVKDIEQAKAMEKEQMKEMYLKGIENYDPTFKRKSTWTTSKKDKAFMKS